MKTEEFKHEFSGVVLPSGTIIEYKKAFKMGSEGKVEIIIGLSKNDKFLIITKNLKTEEATLIELDADGFAMFFSVMCRGSLFGIDISSIIDKLKDDKDIYSSTLK